MSASATAIPSRSSLGPLTGSYGIVFVIGLLAVIVATSASWIRFPTVWNSHHEHGYVAAAFCLWLVWRDRKQMLSSSDVPAWWVLLPLVGASLLWMLAVAISVQVVHLALAPIVLLLWLWAARGQRAMFVALPIAMVFMLAVPVWEVLTTPLQNLTVLINQLLLSVTSIKAEITGTEIHLSAGTIVVAASCSGLNYLQSGLTLGAMYALAFVRDWRTQIKVVLVAAGLALISNWIRVFGLVIVGHVTEMRAHLLQEHGVYGWVIFALTIPVFGWLARKVELRDARKQLATASATANSHRPTADDSNNFDSSIAMLIAATVAALSGPVLLAALQIFSSPAEASRNISGLTPSEAWQAVSTAPTNLTSGFTDSTVSTDKTVLADSTVSTDSVAPVANDSFWVSTLSGYSQHQQYHYQRQDATTHAVQVDRYIFTSQSQGAEMISDGNRIAPDSVILDSRLIGPLDNNLRMVRETVVSSRGAPRLVWSWYRAGGIETPSGRKAELLEFWGLVTSSSPSETILVSTACDQGNCQQARAALYEVVTGKVMPTGSGKN